MKVSKEVLARGVSEQQICMTLGLTLRRRQYIRALVARGYNVSNWVDDLLPKVEIADQPQVVVLEVVTPRRVGFQSAVSQPKFFAKARKSGWKFCPAEVGLLLGQVHRLRPDTFLGIAMKGIYDPRRDLYGLFALEQFHDGLPRLGVALFGNIEVKPDDQYLFLKTYL